MKIEKKEERFLRGLETFSAAGMFRSFSPFFFFLLGNGSECARHTTKLAGQRRNHTTRMRRERGRRQKPVAKSDKEEEGKRKGYLPEDSLAPNSFSSNDLSPRNFARPSLLLLYPHPKRERGKKNSWLRCCGKSFRKNNFKTFGSRLALGC